MGKAEASASAFGCLDVRGSAGQGLFDQVTDGATFGAGTAGLQLRLNGFHDGAHIFGDRLVAERCGEFFNHSCDQRGESCFIEGFGQKFFDDGDFSSLFRDEIGAVALGELVDGVAALFDHGGEGLFAFCRCQCGALFNGFIFQRGLDEAQSTGTFGVMRFHGRDHVLIDEGFEFAWFGHGNILRDGADYFRALD